MQKKKKKSSSPNSSRNFYLAITSSDALDQWNYFYGKHPVYCKDFSRHSLLFTSTTLFLYMQPNSERLLEERSIFKR